jgi:phenylacetate-CoA ligase
MKHPISTPDYMNVDELRAMQLKKLQRLVAYEYERVPLFRRRCDEKGVKPSDIVTLQDISKLPFMIKNDLRDEYPYGLTAAPMKEIVRFHCSSGTTGKPICIPNTMNDIKVWQDATARSLAMYGITDEDVLQVTYGYGLFTGGLGAHYGTEALGATVVPTSGGNTQRQLMVMQDFGVTAICCTPSYFNFLAEKAAESNMDMRKLPLKVGIFGAEPWTDAMRRQMQANTGIEPYDIYGLSEIIGPGVAIECSEHNGLHIFEDHFYPEIVDPDTGEVLPDGAFGELVITTLTKEAFPMIRYRTHDLTRIISEPCACGRTLRRIDRIASRCDDMMIIRGVNVFPSQIESALLSVDGTMPHYNIILYTEKGMDNIEVDVEVSEKIFSDTISTMEEMQKKLSSAIEHTIGLRVKVKLVAPQTIQRSEGKAKRVIDRRERL